jgi:hypothetical protein
MLSDADRVALATLPTDQGELIERGIRQCPNLTVEKALATLRAASELSDAVRETAPGLWGLVACSVGEAVGQCRA